MDVSELISSVAAVIATGLSLFLLRQGQHDRRQLRWDKEREQARQVTAWADWHSSDEFATFEKPRLPAVFVNNSSDAAVYDVFVDYREPVQGQLLRATIGPVPPDGTRNRVIDIDGPLDDRWEPAALFARINFRDAAGKRWVRDAIGRLGIDPGPGNDGFFEEGGRLVED